MASQGSQGTEQEKKKDTSIMGLLKTQIKNHAAKAISISPGRRNKTRDVSRALPLKTTSDGHLIVPDSSDTEELPKFPSTNPVAGGSRSSNKRRAVSTSDDEQDREISPAVSMRGITPSISRDSTFSAAGVSVGESSMAEGSVHGNSEASNSKGKGIGKTPRGGVKKDKGKGKEDKEEDKEAPKKKQKAPEIDYPGLGYLQLKLQAMEKGKQATNEAQILNRLDSLEDSVAKILAAVTRSNEHMEVDEE